MTTTSPPTDPVRLERARLCLRRALLVLVLLALGLANLHIFFGDLKEGGVRWFNLDTERNVSTWFTGVLFLSVGVAGLVAYYWELRRNHEAGRSLFRMPILWAGVALTGLWMSLDETTILHENLFHGEVRDVTSELGGGWAELTQWQIVYAPVFVLAAAFLAIFFTNRFRASGPSARYALGIVVAWTGAILMEGFRESWKEVGQQAYSMSVMVEETLEIGGAILLLGAIVSYVIDLALDFNTKRAQAIERSSRFLTPRGSLIAGTTIVLLSVGGLFVYRAAVGRAEPEATLTSLDRERLAGTPAPFPDGIWFEDLSASHRLEEPDRAGLARFVNGALRGEDPAPDILGDSWNDDGAPRIVLLALGSSTGPARTLTGSGFGIVTAILDVIDRARELPDSTPKDWIKLDVVRHTKPMHGHRCLHGFERGLHGLAFARSSATALSPGEVVGQSLVNSHGELRPGKIERHLERTHRPTDTLDWDSFGQVCAQLFQFSTRSYWITEDTSRLLYRDHCLFADNELTPEALLESARSAGEYLKQSVGTDGRFVYEYLAKTDVESHKYNILRHAGTTYSMLELYEQDPDLELLEAAQRALTYLARATRIPHGSDATRACVVEDGDAKLGGAALAVIAFAKYTEVATDARYVPLIHRLADWIRDQQDAYGTFCHHKYDHDSGKPSTFRSEYYPGEALLALVRAHRLTPEAGWLDAALKGAEALITIRDGGVATEDLIHDHWLLYALNEIQAETGSELLLKHGSRIAETIENHQRKHARWKDWAGSYYDPPRSTPTATRSEGLAAAFELLRRNGREDEASRALDALRRGVRFQLQTQFRPESSLHLRKPWRALGGFHRSLTDYSVRIDYVQHNISAILALRRFMEG